MSRNSRLNIPKVKRQFSAAIIAHLGIEKAQQFIKFLKVLKLDLSDDDMMIKAATKTDEFSSLMALAETNMPEHVTYTMDEWIKYECTNADQTLMKDSMLSLCGSKDLANNFVSDLRKLGMDVVQKDKMNFVSDRPTVVRLLFVFWALGTLNKAISLVDKIKE